MRIYLSQIGLLGALETYPGKDGIVQTIKAKTPNNELTRPSKKLCLLENNYELSVYAIKIVWTLSHWAGSLLRHKAFSYVVLNVCLLPQCFLFAFCQWNQGLIWCSFVCAIKVSLGDFCQCFQGVPEFCS